MARKRDIKQFEQACRQLRLTPRERGQASRELHAEKKQVGRRTHMGYAELVDWLQEWKGHR